MPETVVAAQSRTETGKNANRRLRASGMIPAVLYGLGRPAETLAVAPKALAAILRSGHGESSLLDLEIGGTRRKVILKDFTVEPIKSQLLHADFYEVALDKPIVVRVHVELTGTPVGVKTQGGQLEFVTRELELQCLPLDIPEKIVIDVSELELGKNVRVHDVAVPKGVTFLSDPGLVIVHVVVPRGEEEAAPVADAAAATTGEPEVIKKGKADGDAAEAPAKGGEKAEKKPEKKEKK
jgi:large subunit ribosomal protein L25